MRKPKQTTPMEVRTHHKSNNPEAIVLFEDDGHHSRHGATMKPVRCVGFLVGTSGGPIFKLAWEIAEWDAMGVRSWRPATDGNIAAYKDAAFVEIAKRLHTYTTWERGEAKAKAQDADVF
jgi:hypothetical protein